MTASFHIPTNSLFVNHCAIQWYVVEDNDGIVNWTVSKYMQWHLTDLFHSSDVNLISYHDVIDKSRWHIFWKCILCDFAYLILWAHSCFIFGKSMVQILAQRPVILTEVFSWFSSVTQGKYQDITPKWNRILSNSLYTNHPLIQCYVIWAVESVE
jgi:hypothetical protein